MTERYKAEGRAILDSGFHIGDFVSPQHAQRIAAAMNAKQAPPAAAMSASGHVEVLRELSATLIGRSQERHAAIEWALERLEAPPAAAVPEVSEMLPPGCAKGDEVRVLAAALHRVYQENHPRLAFQCADADGEAMERVARAALSYRNECLREWKDAFLRAASEQSLEQYEKGLIEGKSLRQAQPPAANKENNDAHR